MKRTSRVLAILLALAMLLSVTAFAAWDVYGGNDNHNSVVTNAPTNGNNNGIEQLHRPLQWRQRLGRR